MISISLHRSFKQVVALGLLASAYSAQALEYPIGKPQQRFGMEIAGVYLQPVAMEPEGMMRKAEESDIHIEADIKALKGNPNGFEEGAWIPYLGIKFEVTKSGTTQKVEGEFMPMVANDGPHYGDNLKLLGPGSYELRLRVQAPSQGDSHAQHFGRHVDKETGVAPWFASCDLNYSFTYVGIGKKGGY